MFPTYDASIKLTAVVKDCSLSQNLTTLKGIM